MEKFYYSPSKNGFYSSNIHTASQIPKDAVEINEQEYKALFAGQSGGKVIVKGEDGKPILADAYVDHEGIEKDWRNAELDRADEELNKVQDADPKAFGTVTQWRQYRKELRAWPEHAEFPNKEFRPKSPDSKE